jgi:hypothetical protein
LSKKPAISARKSHETAIGDYHLSFADQEKQTFVFRFRLAKQTEVL